MPPARAFPCLLPGEEGRVRGPFGPAGVLGLFFQVGSVVCEVSLFPVACVSMELLGNRCPQDFPSLARGGWNCGMGRGVEKALGGLWWQTCVLGSLGSCRGSRGLCREGLCRRGWLATSGSHAQGLRLSWWLVSLDSSACGGPLVACGVSQEPLLMAHHRVTGTWAGCGLDSWRGCAGGRSSERRLSGSPAPGAGGALPRVLWHRQRCVCASEWPW